MDVFVAYGYVGASMSKIAQAADVSKAVLYDCFPGGKRELYRACIDAAETRVEHVRRYWTAAMAGGAPVSAAVAILAGAAIADPPAFRLLADRRGRGDSVSRYRLADLLLADLLRPPNQELTLHVRCQIAMAEELASFPDEYPGDVDVEAFFQHVAEQ